MQNWLGGAIMGLLIWILSIIVFIVGLFFKFKFLITLFFDLHFFPLQLFLAIFCGPGSMIFLIIGPALNLILFPVYGAIIGSLIKIKKYY